MNFWRHSRIGWRLTLAGILALSAGWLWATEEENADEPATATRRSEKQEVRAPAELPVKRAIAKQPRVLTDKLDHRGQPVTVACATCHETRKPDYRAGVEAVPVDFHTSLTYAHGKLSCLSCHNTDDYDTLRRADGQPLAYQNAMALCAQCHGPQTRDYQHGSHGGMVGHWDKSKGPRDRNLCTDCHDVHAPAYPSLMPIFPPRDRGALEQARRDAAAHFIEHATSSTHD